MTESDVLNAVLSIHVNSCQPSPVHFQTAREVLAAFLQAEDEAHSNGKYGKKDLRNF